MKGESEAVLDVSHLVIQQADRTVVQDVSFTAARGEVVVIMGASGSGKTTILRAIAGLSAFASGHIAVDGVSLAPGRLPRGPVRQNLYRRVGMVFQFHHLFEHLTALHNVWLAPVHVLGQERAAAERRALELLDQMGIRARANAMPRELSGGEAQRVAIARALAVGPRVLLMDEPTASLDAARRGELASTLRELSDGGCTVLVASHDEEFVRACSNRVMVMREGKLQRVQ